MNDSGLCKCAATVCKRWNKALVCLYVSSLFCWVPHKVHCHCLPEMVCWDGALVIRIKFLVLNIQNMNSKKWFENLRHSFILPAFFLATSITPAYLSHPSQTPVSCTSSLLHESTNVSMHSGHLCEPLVQNVGMDTMRLEINEDFSQHCSFGTILLLPSFYWKVFQLVP